MLFTKEERTERGRFTERNIEDVEREKVKERQREKLERE